MTKSKENCRQAFFVGEDELFILRMKLIMAVGLNEAIVLQRLHYWLENPHAGIEIDGHKWIYNTYKGWREGDGENQKGNFPFWSERTIQRLFMTLEEGGLIISCRPARARWDHQKYYRINYEVLESLS